MDTMEPQDTLTDVSKEWCLQKGVAVERVSELVNNIDPRIAMALDQALAEVNKEAHSNAQKIQKWAIMPTDFSLPGGELGELVVVSMVFQSFQ